MCMMGEEKVALEKRREPLYSIKGYKEKQQSANILEKELWLHIGTLNSPPILWMYQSSKSST